MSGTIRSRRGPFGVDRERLRVAGWLCDRRVVPFFPGWLHCHSAVVADIMGWSASTAVRMIKRYGHIRPDAQRRALEGIATAQIPANVNQIVHQVANEVESQLP